MFEGPKGFHHLLRGRRRQEAAALAAQKREFERIANDESEPEWRRDMAREMLREAASNAAAA